MIAALGLLLAVVATMPNAFATLGLAFNEAVSEAIHAIASGEADELLMLGTRGEGKTQGALGAMLAHAERHQAAGFPLPTLWLGVTDTFDSHEKKTHESLADPMWQACWQLSKGGHQANFRLAGATLVRVQLFGVDSPRDESKVRTQCHGVWFEEPAPATDLSSGITERAWEVALTSRRLPTHAKAGVITANYPDEDHWLAQRFLIHPRPGTAVVEIPPGERATDQDRAEWASKISDPILRGRLLDGRLGMVMLGERVAVGYNPALHVAPEPLRPVRGELWFGHDSAPGAHTHATVIGQRLRGIVRIYAGLVNERKTGLKQHLHETVLPWLEQSAPWALQAGGDQDLIHRYDPAMDTQEGGDIDQSPVLRLQTELGGHFLKGPVPWPARIGPLLALFDSAVAGAPALQINPGPDTELLRKALAGRWDYAKNAAGTVARDLPRKPNHPWEDLGDGFCYLIGGLAPSREVVKPTPRAALKYGRILGAMR